MRKCPHCGLKSLWYCVLGGEGCPHCGCKGYYDDEDLDENFHYDPIWLLQKRYERYPS
jgi:hypothetical protein